MKTTNLDNDGLDDLIDEGQAPKEYEDVPALVENLHTKLAASRSLKHQETREGLPVMDSEDFYRMYNTDVRVAGEGTSATFNFQGYVREDRPGMESSHGTYYRDVVATNGLLKGNGHAGIHVGIDGVVKYNAREQNQRMQSAREVGEYDIYITVPGALQRELGSVCRGDRCISVGEYLADDYSSTKDLEYLQSQEGCIVMWLRLNPKKDPLAREKVIVINNAIVRHIEQRRPLHEIEQLVRKMEDAMNGIRPEDLRNRLNS